MVRRPIYRATPIHVLAVMLGIFSMGCPNPNWGITFKSGDKWRREHKLTLLDGGFTVKIKGYEGATSDIRGNEFTLHFQYMTKLDTADFCIVPESLEVFCQGKELPQKAGGAYLDPNEDRTPECVPGLPETFVFRWEIDRALLTVNERGSITPLALQIKLSGMMNYRGRSLKADPVVARATNP